MKNIQINELSKERLNLLVSTYVYFIVPMSLCFKHAQVIRTNFPTDFNFAHFDIDQACVFSFSASFSMLRYSKRKEINKNILRDKTKKKNKQKTNQD